MADVAPSRVWETTLTTGTGTLTLQGAVAGFSQLTSTQNGKTYAYTVANSDDAEWGEGTYTHSTRTFTRNTVYGNSAGTTAKINFGSGEKDFFIGPIGELSPGLNIENIWNNNQKFRGKYLYLDATDDTYIYGDASHNITSVVNGEVHTTFDGTNKYLRTELSRTDAAEGPGMVLHRSSSAPAANDSCGYLRMTGKDAGGNTISLGKIRTVITDPTNGAAGSRLTLEAAYSGSLRQQLNIRHLSVYTGLDVDLLTNNKQTSDIAQIGCEMLAGGQLVAVCEGSGGAPLNLNITGSGNDYVYFYRSGVEVGKIWESGGTVHYDAFAGSHPTWWDEVPETLPPRGTVLVAGDSGQLHPHYGERIPLVRPSTQQGDTRVCGIFVQVAETKRANGDGKASTRSEVKMDAVGATMIRVVGPVAAGDLLWTSAIPGCAERQPAICVGGVPVQLQTNTTVGKVCVTSDEVGERLLPCFAYCG